MSIYVYIRRHTGISVNRVHAYILICHIYTHIYLTLTIKYNACERTLWTWRPTITAGASTGAAICAEVAGAGEACASSSSGARAAGEFLTSFRQAANLEAD